MLSFMAAAMVACAPKERLVILHVNDTHSHFEPLRGGDQAGYGGSIERAAFVDSVRAAEGADRVLLLHAGDFSQGSSYFSELKGTLEPRVMNDMGYDCSTIGNHEFDNGIEALCERAKVLNFPLVCANVDLSQFELGEYIKPYAILERAGMKIGVIGLEADLSTNVSATISSRLRQLDNVEVVNKWASYLHSEEKCDLIILLSHIGYEEDMLLVPQISYVNLIIGGHSHTFVEDLVYVKDARGKKVPVIQDGCWGLEMGKIVISGGC